MGKIAFVFAGQGAQAVGMGQDLYEAYDSVKALFDLAEAKRPGISELILNGPKEQLDITVNTQPALFLIDLACAELLAQKGISADGVAGFSLGEIPAACYAGIMDKEQAFDFVSHRGSVMQECAQRHKGTMFAVVKLPSDEVEHICAALPQAYPVNFNAPGQTVVACAESTASQLQANVVEAGGKAIKLTVSGAFHSPFMDEASESLGQYLEKETLGKMEIPLYANMTASVYDDPKTLLTKQVNHPVLWQKTIENMVADGFDTFIEVGPGNTLSKLISKIADVRVYNVSDAKSLEQTVEELRHA